MQPALEPRRYHADQVRALNVEGLTKRFPGVVALEDVTFDVWTGEVHALVGENGAGKSTLIKAVTGAETPDAGAIEIFGDTSLARSVFERRAAGVSAIYQELMIVPHMSAAANVYLHDPPRGRLLLQRKVMRDRFLELAGRLGLAIDPDAPAGTLSIADRQMIEIMRALATRCRILIMDEPTAAIGPKERAKLFGVIEELKRAGTAIIYISHDLDEVLAISDRVSVLRNGRLVATAPRDHWTKEKMVADMIGTKSVAAVERARTMPTRTVLSVTDLTVPGKVSDIEFSLGEGEILGIAGLVGSGRTEILRALAGVDPGATARLFMDGKELGLPRTVAEAIARGIVLVPEDRKAHGFIPLMTGTENVALTNLGAVSRLGVFSRGRSRRLAIDATVPLGFAESRLDRPVRTLSGGNQQKLVIGKWLHRTPRVLLLDEPTRGVDIGAKAEIYASIRALAVKGLAVILVSSELPEVVEQSDRVLVLSRGRLAGSLDRGEATVERILSLIFSVEGHA